MTTLERARRYVFQLGLSVFPVPPHDGRHDGKTPATRETCGHAGCHAVIPWREFATRCPIDRELVAWFGAGVPMNIAIVTGAVSGVVVVDLDSREGWRYFTRRFPYTPWQTKTGKGWHLFYAHPGVVVRNRARIDTPGGKLPIDVRGDGGYVIAPGSVHATGALYEFAGDWSQPREALPRFWPGWLARPTRPAAPERRAQRPTGDLVERARRYLAAIPKPEIGQGSDAAVLSAACRLVRGFEIGESDAVALLWEWAGCRPGWTHEWIVQKVAHAERYGTEPIGALR